MERISEKTFEKYIKGMMDISRAITSDLYLEDILKLIVMVTAKVTGVEICSLWLVDKDETAPKLKLKATQAIDPDYVKERSLNMDEGVVGFVATHKTPLVLENVLADKRFKEKDMARKLGLVSMLSVPLMVKNNETEKNLVMTVANQAAVAIMNTELMVKTRVIQEELEARKLIERAKEILMVRRNMTGRQAYRWLQKRSMDVRKPMRQIAEAVILSDEI